MGVVVVWAGQPSHARESWLAHASHLPNIPYLSCLLVLVPCLLLEAPSCSSLVGLSGPQDHFGCKWLPWGSPVRAPLATPVALPRAFMLISIPRIRVQLCTTANNCANSDFTPKTGSPMFPATKAHKSKQALRRSHHLSIYCSCQRGLCSNSPESIFSFLWPFGGGGNPLMRERAGLLMHRISPLYHT